MPRISPSCRLRRTARAGSAGRPEGRAPEALLPRSRGGPAPADVRPRRTVPTSASIRCGACVTACAQTHPQPPRPGVTLDEPRSQPPRRRAQPPSSATNVVEEVVQDLLASHRRRVRGAAPPRHSVTAWPTEPASLPCRRSARACKPGATGRPGAPAPAASRARRPERPGSGWWPHPQGSAVSVLPLRQRRDQLPHLHPRPGEERDLLADVPAGLGGA